jgi:hypothetical protein
VTAYVVDKDALILRAKDLLKQSVQRNVQEPARQSVLAMPETSPSMVSAAPTRPVLLTSPQSTLPPDYADYIALRQALQRWRAAWSQHNVEDYLASYVPNFSPETGGDTNAWKVRSRSSLASSADISVEIADLSVTLTDAAHPSMVFKQTYRSQGTRNVVTKTLLWVRAGDRWLIARESSEAVDPGTQ